MPNAPVAKLDFETRSACSLRNCGSWRYSLDATTEVLCAAFRLPHWEAGRTGLWHPAFPQAGLKERIEDLADLFRWTIGGGIIEAHSAFFERGIWTNQLSHWPKISPHQWRCSAAKAAAHSLPRGLRDAAALELDVRKDDAALRTALDLDGETTRAMTKISQPRKPNKADKFEWGILFTPCKRCVISGKVDGTNPDTGRAKKQPCPACKGLGYRPGKTVPPMPLQWHESKEQLLELFEYCRRDVLAEEAVSDALPDLNPFETEIYALDQIINERGFQLNRHSVAAALHLIDCEVLALNGELSAITNGKVKKATQRAQMMAWLETQGLKISDTRKETLDELLDMDAADDYPPWVSVPTPAARRGIELMRALGRSSTAKYGKMRSWACPDWRVRGGLLYHGAGTGRWSGAGIQPHNFPKGSTSPALKKSTQEEVWAVVETRDSALVTAKFGNVMETLSHGLRGAITAKPGYQLYVADYAGIEARVVNWLAKNEDALELFRNGADVYCDMADSIYGYATNKKDHPVERGIGKFAVLGLGYQMGASKFVALCATAGVDIKEDVDCIHCGLPSRDHRFKRNLDHVFEAEDANEIYAVKVVDAYREKYWRVKDMWNEQERAAIGAVIAAGDEHITAGYVTWLVEGDFLYCELPSGRRLAYPFPEIHQDRTSWGKVVDKLTFMGVSPITRQWQRQSTYGGSLVENITQAVSRDIMAEAMVRCEKSGLYMPVLTVHDEIVAETPLGAGNVKAFEVMVAKCPRWAAGLPVAAEGWRGVRYHK